MKKLFFIISLMALAWGTRSSAQLPSRTPENVDKYKSICKQNIYTLIPQHNYKLNFLST